VLIQFQLLLVVFREKYFFSENRGDTWQVALNNYVTIISSIAINNKYGIAVGDDLGTYYKTTNSGRNWFPDFDAKFCKYGVSQISDSTFFAVGGDLNFFKTPNFGLFWERKIFSDRILDFSFGTKSSGWILTRSILQNGPYNTIYQTTNNGITWIKNNTFPYNTLSADLTTVYSKDSLITLISARSAKIYKTSNNGITWYITDNDITGGGCEKLFFLNDRIGWAVFENKLKKTTNSGESWFDQLDAPNLKGIFFSDTINGWVVGRYLYKTANGGTNWSIQTTIQEEYLKDIYFKDKVTGWILSYGGLFKTTNGGQTWIQDFTTGGGVKFCIKSKKNIFIISDKIYESNDSGMTWQRNNLLSNYGILSMKFFDGAGFSMGEMGLIMRYNDTLSKINSYENINLDQAKLFQNHPNPFNAFTKINYYLSHPCYVSLRVYDILCNEVATLVNEEKEPGRYTVQFDASKLSSGVQYASGVYIYSLTAGDFKRQIRCY
jgi:photosystem II stability/assembly factor-like uncharacterized protein